jgi:hypothetical protein
MRDLSPEHHMELSAYGMLIFGRWWLLEARIAFRKRWVLENKSAPAPYKFKFNPEHNYARIGEEFVDEDWGKPPVRSKLRRAK